MKYILGILVTLILTAGCAPGMKPYQRPVSYAQTPSFFVPPPIKTDDREFRMIIPPFKKDIPHKGVIVVDAGHGGKDEGTQSLEKPIYLEKNLTMSTAFLVKNFLEQFGYKVAMTRQDDVFIALEQRALFANQLKPALFVSIHYNSAPSTDAEGIEIFYYRNDENKNRVTKSKELAQAILDHMLEYTQAKSRGIKHANFAVIRETEMAAILIEGGFLTNANEMQKIKTPSYQKSLALGIAKGVEAYMVKQKLLKKS